MSIKSSFMFLTINAYFMSLAWGSGEIVKKKRAMKMIILLQGVRDLFSLKQRPKASIALLFECSIWDNCPKGLIFPNLI